MQAALYGTPPLVLLWLFLAAAYGVLLSQKHFTFAEANLGSGADSMPLIVMAISDNLLSWPAYAKHYSKLEQSLQGETLQGHFNHGVQAAAAEVRGTIVCFTVRELLSTLLSNR